MEGWGDQYSRWCSSVSGKDTDVCTDLSHGMLSGTSRAHIELYSSNLDSFICWSLKHRNEPFKQYVTERTKIFGCLSQEMSAERGDTEACLFGNSTSAVCE